MTADEHRQIVLDKLPLINQQNKEVAYDLTLTIDYYDNIYVTKFLEFVQPVSISIYKETLQDISSLVINSGRVRTGSWLIRTDGSELSTGSLCECVCIIVQCQKSNFVAMHHYFYDADKNFERFKIFINEIDKTIEQLLISKSDYEVSLVSSFLTANYYIIREILLARSFSMKCGFVDKKVCLKSNGYEFIYVNSGEESLPVGLMVFASPSEIKICKHLHKYDDVYACDIEGIDRCSIM